MGEASRSLYIKELLCRSRNHYSVKNWPHLQREAKVSEGRGEFFKFIRMVWTYMNFLREHLLFHFPLNGTGKLFDEWNEPERCYKRFNKEFSIIFQLCQHNVSDCVQQDASLKHKPEVPQLAPLRSPQPSVPGS